MRNQLISSLMTALSSMIAPDDMKKAEEVCTSVMSSYHVEKTGTELAVYEPIPQAFKDYITTRHIEGLSKNTLKTYSLVLMRFFPNDQSPYSAD